MEHIHAQVLKMLKSIVMGVKYLSINYDEMMFIDKQQWLYNWYMVDN